MTLPGCPAIFYGDEIDITGDNDPLCRQAMQWDKSKQDLHTKEWYKKLIKCRRNSKVFQEGDFHTLYVDDENGVYAFSRSVDNDVAIIILNTGTKEIPIPPQKGPTDKTLTVLFNENAAFSALQNELCSETKCFDEEMLKELCRLLFLDSLDSINSHSGAMFSQCLWQAYFRF